MTPTELSLLDYMQTLSRKYFHSPWENGLEFILWHWMRDRCECPLDPIEKFTLYSRYNKASGWFITIDDEPHYLKREAWLVAYEREFNEDSED